MEITKRYEDNDLGVCVLFKMRRVFKQKTEHKNVIVFCVSVTVFVCLCCFVWDASLHDAAGDSLSHRW